MNIILKDQYKSLRPFESEELNNFTIITGKNGSGKSQLLDIIKKKSVKDPLVAGIRFELMPNPSRIQSEGIIKDNSVSIGHAQWKQLIENQLNEFKRLSETGKRMIVFIMENELETKALNIGQAPLFLDGKLFSDKDEYKELLSRLNAELRNTQIIPIENVNSDIQRRSIPKIFNNNTNKLYRFVKELCAYTGKTEFELTDSDFYNTPIQEHLIDSDDLFSSQVELIFYNYALRRDQNRKKFFYKKEDGEENNSTSDDEFVKTFVPPWELINEILLKHGINFYFNGIDKRQFTTEIPVNFQLSKKTTNEVIPFNDLSSGEKVIIGLILKLFTSEFYEETLTFPDLLILDEPDAHLHPEMSKLLLDVLENTFVNKYGIRVIMTTHSPSTIALASENQIFQLTNGIDSSLKKISKDEALKILTSFIPTLSIDYKNHRQVFVESPTDVIYYQYLHDKHVQNNRISFKLYFISNSAGKSNCDQVYKIVEQMRGSGSLTSYGIVDWDLKNKPENFVYVHGFEERYSVENFILDPIYLICLLIDTNNAYNILGKIGLDKTYNQYLLGNETEERLQNILRYFFSEFETKFPAFKYDSDKEIVKYFNGRKLEVPKWYLLMKGHDIVDKIKVIYPMLETKYKTEGELQNALTIIMSKYYPFVPLSSIEIIEGIGNHT